MAKLILDNYLSKEEIYEMFTVDFDKGKLYHKRPTARNRVYGKEVGHYDKKYLANKLKVNGKHIRRSIVMILASGQTIDPDTEQVDHINRDVTDDRLVNLRVVSKAENMRNRRPFRGSASPFKGVTKSGGKWMARSLSIAGIRHYLGKHDTQEEAARVIYDYHEKNGGGEYLNYDKQLVLDAPTKIPYIPSHSGLITKVKADRPFVCHITGSTEDLNIHHIDDSAADHPLYTRMDNIVVLTRLLHRDYHNKYQNKPNRADYETWLTDMVNERKVA